MKREIFVFGSNLAGRHGKGAALTAYKTYGAIYGQGIGLQGDSYAIPTKDEKINTLPLSKIKKYVEQFIKFATLRLKEKYSDKQLITLKPILNKYTSILQGLGVRIKNEFVINEARDPEFIKFINGVTFTFFNRKLKLANDDKEYKIINKIWKLIIEFNDKTFWSKIE
jgi:hypothetical protein